MVSRCSVSTTSGGLLSRNRSGCPSKSVTVTNRSSGWPSGISGGPAVLVSIASNASSSRLVKPSPPKGGANQRARSEEHTSELQSLMRISYAVFCLKKKTRTQYYIDNNKLSERKRTTQNQSHK